MTIIGIAGGTGSGKTTVVRKIVEALPECSVAIIPQDSYYKDQSHIPLEDRRKTNFDHPDAFEWPLFVKQINDLKEGRAIEQPVYSYIINTRLKETIHIDPKDVIIVEGIMALYDKDMPMHDQYIEPTKQYADIIIPNGGDNAKAIAMLQQYVRSFARELDLKKL